MTFALSSLVGITEHSVLVCLSYWSWYCFRCSLARCICCLWCFGSRHFDSGVISLLFMEYGGLMVRSRRVTGSVLGFVRAGRTMFDFFLFSVEATGSPLSRCWI